MGRFRKATREQLKLRMALDGPSGSGKTYTLLRCAFAMARRVDGGRVVVIDSEHKSACKYAGDAPDGTPFVFDHYPISNYAPSEYTAAIKEAGEAGYTVLVIDSLSHAWAGEGGALEIKDSKGPSIFGWKEVTPLHNAMITAILQSPCHVLASMRSKTEWSIEKDAGGKTEVSRIGLAPVQRAGMEYEFDIYGSLDLNHMLTITKSRCPSVDRLKCMKPTADFMTPIIRWLEEGERPAPRASGEQIDQINDLVKRLDIQPERFTTGLRRTYSVDAVQLLSVDQAEELMKRLLLKEQEAKKAAESAAEKSNGTGADIAPQATV